VVESLARSFDAKLFSDEMIDEIVRRIRESADFKEKKSYESSNGETRSYDQFPMFSALETAIEIVNLSQDPNCLPVFLDYWRELKSSPDDKIGRWQEKSDLLRNYFRSHGLDAKRVEGFRANVFPLIEANDSEVDGMVDATNAFPMHYGGFGVSDYNMHCLVSEVSPRYTAELIQAYREIPTSSFSRFEQNRQDAAALMGALWRGRDWIHDELPGIHDVVSAMLDYYESRDDETARAEKEAALLRVIAEKPYAGLIGDFSLDLANYEKPIKKRVGRYNDGKVLEETEPAIDVLRRIVKNTEQVTLEKPHTEDEGLNALLEQLDVRPNERTGEVHVNWNQVGELVRYTNDLLRTRQGQIGMRPSMIAALAYIEKIATYSMRGVGRKDWQELPYDPHFKEICRFRELVSSADGYSENDFENFWNGFSRVPYPEEGYSRLAPDYTVLREHYRRLQTRTLRKIDGLAKMYISNPHTAYLTGALWSGNLNHEIVGLVDER
jgi:hypothetical protein